MNEAPWAPPGQRGQDMLERMIARTEANLAEKPDYSPRLLTFAEEIATQGHSLKAYILCRKAVAASPEDSAVARQARRLLNRLVPGYHIPMMNDRRRNLAWDKAFRELVKPGCRALEIGTGAGMLTLMAARAGAEHITTCEFHPVVAEVAREIVAQNGYAEKVDVLSKGSQQMQVGVDLKERADLLFCDNFSDNFFSFQPLHSIADARARLLKPGAACLPARAAVKVALGEWESYGRFFQARESCGFDISPVRHMPSESVDLEIGDPGIHYRSADAEIFRFDFSQSTFKYEDSVDLELVADRQGTVNGVLQWIRLELSDEVFLEARPEPGAHFFSNPRFYPFEEPVQAREGEAFKVRASHNGRSLEIYRI